MVKRIDSLTDEQRAQMGPWADMWIKIGLRTISESDEADEKRRGEAAMKAYYKFAGLDEPKIYWVRSPVVAVFAGAISVCRLAGGDVDLPVWFTPEMRAECLAVLDQISPPGPEKATVAQISDLLWSRLGGHLWPSWVAWRSFAPRVCELELEPEVMAKLEAWEEVTKCVGWWWPANPAGGGRPDVQPYIVASWRPEVLLQDNQHRLHNETGPALRYPDGFEIYSINGVRVPKSVVTREFTAQDIASEQNAEVRRVMLRLYGEGKFIDDIGAKPLDKSEYGALYRIDLRDDEPLVMVRLVDATPAEDLLEQGHAPESEASRRIYWLRVHPELRPMRRGPTGDVVLGTPQPMTARNAVASTFGKYGHEYNPVLET